MPTAETNSPAKNAEPGHKKRTSPAREKDRVDSFARRHIGPNQEARAAMLAEIEFENLDALIDATVPKSIRLDRSLDLPGAASEWDALAELRQLARKNIVARSF
ncbi:MAG: glycine dehydrogenase, partial [Verrucomicrobiota bacterium]